MATTQELTAGERVEALDVSGNRLLRRAVSGVVQGHDFPVVWVTREDEWQLAQSEGRAPEAVPWPAEDVTRVENDEDEAETAYRVVHDLLDGD